MHNFRPPPSLAALQLTAWQAAAVKERSKAKMNRNLEMPPSNKNLMSTTVRLGPVFSLTVAMCLAATHSTASEPVIESVAPPVGQRGTDFEIAVEGEGFEGCQGLVFYSPSIRCKSIEVVSDYEIVAKIHADAACPLGSQPFRVLSRFGFSDMRTLRVTPFPVLLESAGPGPTKIEQLSGQTCVGVLESGDIDKYHIELKKGERLSVEIEAVRLGYGLLDTVLSVHGPNGKSLLRTDDDPLFQQDPVGSIVAPEDGQYTVIVHETNYQGGLTSYYALHVGTFPRPGVVFPAGGAYGRTVELAILDPAGFRNTQIVRLPPKSNAAGFQLLPTANASNPAPTPLPFRLGQLTSVLETEPNDAPDQATLAASSPVALDGILQAPGDVDYFQIAIPFSPDESPSYRLEAFADRVGSPIDCMLRLFDADGQLVSSNDDWGSHDSRIEFVPRRDSVYFLEVTDKLGGGSPNGVYRIEVNRTEPKLTTFLPRPNRVSQDSQTISVPRGNRMLKRVAVKREYVEGEVQLQFVGLPAGVHASPISIPDDQFWVPVVLRADTDAPIAGSLAQLNATCATGFNLLEGSFEQTVDLVHSTADQLFNSVTVDRVAVAVTPEIPFRVDLETPATGLPAGGRLKLKATVNRQDNFKEPIRVRLPFLPPWVVSDAHIVIPADETVGYFDLQARPEATSRDWQLVASATVDTVTSEGDIATVDGREVSSEPVPIRIVENPVRGEFNELAGEQGDSVQAICSLEKTSEFQGDFTATLEGLPNRITSQPVSLTHASEQIEFQIEVADDAPLGTFERVQCRLSGSANGQEVSYVVATRTTLIVMEPGKLKRDAEGHLLSPLEALRNSK